MATASDVIDLIVDTLEGHSTPIGWSTTGEVIVFKDRAASTKFTDSDGRCWRLRIEEYP